MATHGCMFRATPNLLPVDPETARPSRRGLRVVILCAAIALMSLADLQITMSYLRSGGMQESNPVARLIMVHGSGGLLVVWKCASVAFACLIFFKYRTRRSSEIACWVCVGVMIWLLLRWMNYADEASHLTSAIPALSDAGPAQWVQISE